MASSAAATSSSVPSALQSAGLGLRAHLAQRVGLGLAPALGHRLGEVGEDHGEEEPDRDGPGEDARVRDRLDEGDDRADEDDEHHRVLTWTRGSSFLKESIERLAEDLAVEEAARLGHAVRDGRRSRRLGGRDGAGGRRGGLSERRSCARSPSEELAWLSCSTIGPSETAGKNVRPPMMMMTPIVEADEHRRCRSGTCRATRATTSLRRQRAAEGEGRDHDAEAPEQHVDAADDVVERRVAGEPAEGRAVVVALRGEGVEDLGEAVRAVRSAGLPGPRRPRRRCRSG